MKQKWIGVLAALLLLSACAAPDAAPIADVTGVPYVELADEAVALSEAPAALPATAKPLASGKLVKQSSQAIIDYSETAQGYVMVCYTQPTDLRLKAQVKGPTTTYT